MDPQIPSNIRPAGRGRGRTTVEVDQNIALINNLRRPNINPLEAVDGEVSMVNNMSHGQGDSGRHIIMNPYEEANHVAMLANNPGAAIINQNARANEMQELLGRLHQVEISSPSQKAHCQDILARLHQVDMKNAEQTIQVQGPVPTAPPPVLKSKPLSASAPVFVPRQFAVQNQEQHQQQQHHQQQHLNDQQAQQYMQQMMSQQYMGNHMLPEPQLDLYDHPIIVEVNNLVVDLSNSPDRFHSISRRVCGILRQTTDHNVVKEVVTVIFEQGIGEPNFRYNGAKLCAELCRNVDRIFNQKTFKSILLQRLGEEFEARAFLLHNQPDRYRGYLMFLAEIFTQVTTPDNAPLQKLGESICELLKLLSTTLIKFYPQDDANVSCITKVLKFTGSMLDAIEHERMESIFTDIRHMLTLSLKESSKRQLLNVIELRAGNWGKGPPSPKSETPKPENNQVPIYETVYYGPNGPIQKVDENYEDSISDVDEVPPFSADLDPEAAAAFEEFLKLQET